MIGRKLLMLMLAVAVSGTGGCLVNSHGEKVVGEAEQRKAVDFENDTAVRIFTETVKDRYPDSKDLGKSRFAIPFLIAASEKRVLSENAFFNREVQRADLDADGEISEAEARAHARKWEE